jgi:precorrin-6B methylase 2
MNMESNNILAPFNPTCSQARIVALQLLDLQKDDILFDLGCGDGTLLEDACRLIPGLSCVGIEMDPIHFQRACQHLQQQHLQQQSQENPFRNIDLREGDALNVEIYNKVDGLSLTEDATAIFLYLLPKGLIKIRPILETIWMKRREEKITSKPFRIVSYMFRIPDWEEPTRINRETKGECPLYLYELNPM